MCLIFLSLQQHPRYKLIVAANRDEFYARHTAPAEFWPDAPNVLGGRDLEAGGTWMAVNKQGKISMVTNYRDVANLKTVAPSRGHLVSDFLLNNDEPATYLQRLRPHAAQYNGFNLILGNADSLWYLSNYKEGLEEIKPGFHALSNHLLDSPWPKVVRGSEKMKPAFTRDEINVQEIFELLHDTETAPDDQLPNTGLPLDRERALSSMFIKTPNYGSRSSTVLTVDHHGNLTFTERVYNLSTFQFEERTFSFAIAAYE